MRPQADEYEHGRKAPARTASLQRTTKKLIFNSPLLLMVRAKQPFAPGSWILGSYVDTAGGPWFFRTLKSRRGEMSRSDDHHTVEIWASDGPSLCPGAGRYQYGNLPVWPCLCAHGRNPGPGRADFSNRPFLHYQVEMNAQGKTWQPSDVSLGQGIPSRPVAPCRLELCMLILLHGENGTILLKLFSSSRAGSGRRRRAKSKGHRSALFKGQALGYEDFGSMIGCLCGYTGQTDFIFHTSNKEEQSDGFNTIEKWDWLCVVSSLPLDALRKTT